MTDLAVLMGYDETDWHCPICDHPNDYTFGACRHCGYEREIEDPET